MAPCTNPSEFPMYPRCTKISIQAASLKDKTEVDKALIEYAKACIEAQVIQQEATVQLAESLKKISGNLDQ
jgi:hypothetical protein